MWHIRKTKRSIIFLCVFFFIGGTAYSDLAFSLRFFDKKIYYPESDIELKITLTNQSPGPYRFRISDNRAYSLGFDVRNLANQPLRLSRKFIIDRNSNQPVFFRDVHLEAGEEFSFTVNLKDYIEIENPGNYSVKALFYPDLYTGTSQTTNMTSNTVSLSVRPSTSRLEAIKAQIDQDTGEILKEIPLSPDAVVAYTIDARRRGQWNKFFLYLDIESLFQRSPLGARTYKNSSESERIEAIKKYREELVNQRIDNEILTIPSEYEIIKTTYTSREGTVEVLQKFAYQGYREVKQYTYYLYKKDTIWKIYNYEVRNIGTE
jgi:hypothetical protein